MRLSAWALRRMGGYAIAVAKLPHLDPASDIQGFSSAVRRTVLPIIFGPGSSRPEVLLRERHWRLQRFVSEVLETNRRYPCVGDIPEEGCHGFKRWLSCWRGIAEERGLAEQASLASAGRHGRGRNRHRRRLLIAGDSYWNGLTKMLEADRRSQKPEALLSIALSLSLGGSFSGALADLS